jgi:molybdate transport system substrate-binding protein
MSDRTYRQEIPMFRLTHCGSLLALVLLSGALGAPALASAAEVTVFAAASLKNALDAIAADWQTSTGNTVTISHGGSSKLAKQIEQGAPADIFISAASSWMDTLQGENLLKADTRKDILGNSLVLVAFGKDAPKVEIGKDTDLMGMPKDGRLAMAMVDSVPAGQYGKQSLESLGLWAGGCRPGGRSRGCARDAEAGGIRRGALWHRLCVGRHCR